jgi:hypothetical protein
MIQKCLLDRRQGHDLAAVAALGMAFNSADRFASEVVRASNTASHLARSSLIIDNHSAGSTFSDAATKSSPCEPKVFMKHFQQHHVLWNIQDRLPFPIDKQG